MSYRLGESDEAMHYGASRDRNVDGRKSNSRIVCEKEVAYLSLVLFSFVGKILISLWFKTKKPLLL
jgi:hypothetical protein